jgi:anaerobic magnesium-protoporphyrin IX monomethyl ester cyclase
MPKIIFIEPKAPNMHIFSQYHLPRLGSFILGTLMKKRGWDVKIYMEEKEKIDFEAIKQADIVGISTITSTAPRAYALADRIREMGKTVIMGGPHVSYLSEEALEHCDFVVRGEGETALMKFIDAWETNKNYSDVPNLSYKKETAVVHNTINCLKEDLSKMPYPDFSLSKGNFEKVWGYTIIPVQTSRGCPFDCSFCSVTGMFGKKYRFRPTQHIIEELKQYNHKKNFIFFYDDNFTADRKRAKDLLKAMIKENFQFKWSTQVRVDIVKDLELVHLMKQAGCHTLYIGFESVNPDTLKAIKKNQTVLEIENAIKILQQNHINIHGMFVFGFDEDDKKTVRASVKFAKRNRLTSVQFLILTPLPGSELYENLRAQNRIKFNDWALYDAHHVVFEPKRFSFIGLQMAQVWGHKKFYSIKESYKRFSEFKFEDVLIAGYARKLNRGWLKTNRTYLKIMDLLTPRKNENITIQYNQKILLDS